MNKLDKYRGCMIGGAVGDALGYAVEFFDINQIIGKYGESGITEYALNRNGEAEISDDTQMSMYTANALLFATTRGMMRGIMGEYPSYIGMFYRDWLKTQTDGASGRNKPEYSYLNNLPELNHRRAPGNTCVQSLSQDTLGSIDAPKNNSKGCGGVMRVAPVGLYLGGRALPADDVARIGAETAALTHGHELGYIPAAALTHIVNTVSHSDTPLLQAVEDAKASIKRLFSSAKHISSMIALIDRAIALSKDAINDTAAIRILGEGWVAEETLAIAIYCALRHPDSFEKAVVASVNHSGDSDSTGAVTGNIMGAYLGMKAIPQKFLERLELKDAVLELADDLYNDCRMSEYGTYRDPVWIRKYITHAYPGE